MTTPVLADDHNDLIFSLLPSTPYVLAYAVPLVSVSLLLTFVGTFLTLDRTRTFPHFDPELKPSPYSRLRVFLDGGVGGYASGYAFGVHLSTFLALLIPSLSSSPPLTSTTFLMTWLLSALPCLVGAGRWRYMAFALSGISGYVTLALAVSVLVHPSLLTRIVLTAILAPIGTSACLLIPHQYIRIPLRIATSSTGAFGTVFSIALFARISSWGGVWERYWIKDSIEWGTNTEKGLSAAYWVLLCLGIVSDWFIHSRIGENPDEKWDRCLANYGANFDTPPNRSGTFVPPVSLWDRLKKQHFGFQPVTPPTFSVNGLGADPLDVYPPATKLRKHQATPGPYILPLSGINSNPRLYSPDQKYDLWDVTAKRRTRQVVKFGEIDGDSSDSDDETLQAGERSAVSKSRHFDKHSSATNSMVGGGLGERKQNTDVNWITFWQDVKAKADPSL